MPKKNPKFLEHEHTPESIQHRLRSRKIASPMRDIIYGAVDGTITTFAIVAGVRGANLTEATILILGLSNVLADGFSMASGNYLGIKSEIDSQKLITQFEEHQMKTNPKGEEEEIRQILINKGLEGNLLNEVVSSIIHNKGLWLKTMLAEEYGLAEIHTAPFKSALYTFVSFIAFGLVPLLPYFFFKNNSFSWSLTLTGLSFICLGAIKSKWSLEPWWLSGLKTFLIGTLAASISFLVGWMLGDISNV